jgi:hypothetical protein
VVKYEENKMPTKWKEESICPTHKKADQLQHSNYKAITLPNIVYKNLFKCIINKVTVISEQQNWELPVWLPNGEVYHRSNTNFMANFGEEYVSTFHLCMDLKTACDTVK